MKSRLGKALTSTALTAAVSAGFVGFVAAPAMADDCWYCTANVEDTARSERLAPKFDFGLMVFTVRLGFIPSSPVTVGYKTADGVGVGAATAADGDYIPTSGSITFEAGKNVKSVFVTVKADTKNEPNEKFRLLLTSTSYGHIGTGTGTGTILDDDPSRLTVLQPKVVSEGSGKIEFDVRLSAPLTTPVTVQYTSTPGTATAGSDYNAVAGILTFAPGEVSKIVSVPIIDDSLYEEGDETFGFKLFNPTGVAIAGATASAKILENDIIH